MKRFLLLLVFLSQLVFADDSYLIDDSLAMARQGEFVRASNLIVDLANNGDSTAQYVLSMYFRDPNALNIPEVGEMWLMRAAENNNAKAQYDLGWRLAAGWKNDTVEDIVEMIYWFERATFNGSDDAYANLATLYENEHRNVLLEMEVAANNGNAMAQFNLGWINARGLVSSEGLMQDMDVAKAWFEKSAKLGFKDAVEVLQNNF
ncbi:sel1 repeat family protein [Candidatus Pseudothioglobus singularis]|jgi:TPR repeat protein|nr:sel1 repeat family protein [Candidatus Pseudothioglobus singularis]